LNSSAVQGRFNLSTSWPCGTFPAWPLFFLFLFFAFPSGAFAEVDYKDELADKAVALKLHEKRQWQVLLHYRPTLPGGYKSLVDDPAFFNSPSGKDDPLEEMRATIRSFFRTDTDGDLHPQCRFIARYKWLDEELEIDSSKLPGPDCKGFREFSRNLDPRSAVLIFPVSHMNSPASMFGHTLLRIDSGKESSLFSFAVNYTAVTGETNGILFAAKGLFGFYKGYFGVLPYYEKIKEYSNLENRDMWEYRLEFSREEVERLLLHLWELKDVYTYYYFFDENCSYNLLLVLEAARPGTDIIKLLPPWVIPMDTVKAIKKAGFDSGSALYRPAKATRIRHIETTLGAGPRLLALDMAFGRKDPGQLSQERLSREEKARVLDLASEYLQYRYSREMLSKEEYTASFLKVLGARSAQGLIPEYKVDAPVPPEEGHGPAKIAFGGGVKEGASFLSLKLRPANHALMDPDPGYLPGAAIIFMEGEARYNFTERKLTLERLTFVDINSVAPRDDFFKPVSWRVSADVFREEMRKREHRTVARLSGGPGLSYSASGGLLVYGFIGPEAKFGSGLDDGYALGGSVRAGAIRPLTGWWKAQVELMAASFGPGDSHDIASIEFNQTFSVKRDEAVTLNVRKEKFDGFYSTEGVLSWNMYF